MSILRVKTLVRLRRIPLDQTECLFQWPVCQSVHRRIEMTISTHVRAGPSFNDDGQSSKTRNIAS